MLLSLVGERFRRRHVGVRLAFAYKRVPKIATTLRKLSRYKYGVANKQPKLGNAPDFVESLCDIEFLCWVDSSDEMSGNVNTQEGKERVLEERIVEALNSPAKISRYGVLCLGLSDDAVNEVSLCENIEGKWHRLLPSDRGTIELPVWVDHVGAAQTRWQRYELETEAHRVGIPMPDNYWTQIVMPK
jgi:CRISPR-associated protein Cas5t